MPALIVKKITTATSASSERTLKPLLLRRIPQDALLTSQFRVGLGGGKMRLPKRTHLQLQKIGLFYLALGAVITAGIYILHPVDSAYRSGLLGGSEGFILIGIVMFGVGWKGPNNPDSSSSPVRRNQNMVMKRLRQIFNPASTAFARWWCNSDLRLWWQRNQMRK
jgi:hypothetical protein